MNANETKDFKITKINGGWTLVMNNLPASVAFFKGSAEMLKYVRGIIEPEIKTRVKKAVQLGSTTSTNPPVAYTT